MVNSASSRRFRPQPSKIANIARSRFPVRVSLSGKLPKSGGFTRRQPVANRDPSLRTPFTRWMPAANSGLNRPQSAASYASRLTAAMRTLVVPGARPRTWRLILYRRTTVLLNASRGSEQYQATNSSIACWYPRLESGEPILRRKTALDISRLGITSLVFGRLFFPWYTHSVFASWSPPSWWWATGLAVAANQCPLRFSVYQVSSPSKLKDAGFRPRAGRLRYIVQ
jgi:hypothetical protein